VDTVAKVIVANFKTETLELQIQLSKEYLKYVWKKGSLCLNGVSLTINDIQDDILSFYLIPETLKKTNFKNIRVGDIINIEVDVMAKVILRQRELES
jgi:riboflavin synthase